MPVMAQKLGREAARPELGAMPVQLRSGYRGLEWRLRCGYWRLEMRLGLVSGYGNASGPESGPEFWEGAPPPLQLF